MSRRDSAECRAFRKCFSALVGGITDPGWLAVQLYSRELIGPDLRSEAQKQSIAERVKIVKILSAVEDQIVVSPATKFREFLEVLQNEPSLMHLAARLENSRRELCTPPTSTPSSLPKLLSTCTQPSSSLLTSSSHVVLRSQTLAGESLATQDYPHVALPQETSSSLYPPARTDHLQPHHLVKHTMELFDIQHNHQTPLLQYASYLKSVYTREKLPIYDKWPQVKSKKYINLALIEKEDITKPEVDQFMRATIHGNIDDIEKSKRAMDISQIAQLPDGSQPKCILLEGAPGVGKSTFAWKLCRKWGKGKLLQQYQLVVLLRLRDKSVRAAKNISDLFQYRDHQIHQAVVEEIQRTWGKGVLLLFEGYDELPEELRTENSIFLDVITGRELPEATVLITSRPWASEFLHWRCKRHISQHIEILGFTKDNIQSYLESAIPNDPSLLADLKKYISCYPHINSMMYIPLNSAIVVAVYQNSRKDRTLVPKTMTELYSSLVRSLLLRHLLDHPVHSKKKRWRICSFSDLPQDVYQQLCELGRIAYEGILHDQQVIFSDLPEDFETLGLMQCVSEMYADEGAAVSYNFLHLTVQEYLAAFHLSQQPVEKQIEHFNKHMKVTGSWLMRLYSSHRTHLLSWTSCDESDVEPASNSSHEPDGQSGSKITDNSDIESAGKISDNSDVESGNKIGDNSDFESGNKIGDNSDVESGSHSNGESDVVSRKEYMYHKHFHMVLRFLCGIRKFSGYPDEVLNTLVVKKHRHHRYSDSCDSEYVDDIASVVHKVNLDTLHWLFEAQDNDVIDKLLGSCHIQLKQRVIEGMTTLFDCFVLGYCVSHSNCTWKIDLQGCHLEVEGAEMLVRGAVEEETHCTGGISEIHLFFDDITSEGVKHLLKVPDLDQLINRLEIFDLSLNNNLDSEFCIVLAHVIPHMRHLKILNLFDNFHIGPGGAVPLITSLTTHKSLEELELMKTGIGVEDCRALSKLLSSSTTNLKKLEISGNNFPPEAVELIISGLIHNTTLERLHMSGSCFSLQNTISLASVLRTNHTLVYLSLGYCNIDSDGACQLASALCTNDTLQTLYLGHNPIGVKGATAFAQILRGNHTLVGLSLGYCNIHSDGACQLASALCTNDTLQKLDLRHNTAGVKGATAFAKMLLKNKSLKELYLRDDSIGEEDAQKLNDSLTHNRTVEEVWLPENYDRHAVVK